MNNHYIVQSWKSAQYAELFRIALREGEYTQLYAAVAYATFGGVRVVEKIMRETLGDEWPNLKKRWLVGIDWCRSDPPALSRLDSLGKSDVRVPNGALLIARTNCSPDHPYHPKLFLLCGTETSAIICGSGNLSANGMTGGCECGSILIVKTGAASNRAQLRELRKWFNSSWRSATPYTQLEAQYRIRCKHLVKTAKATPTEDDTTPDEAEHRAGRKPLSETQIRQLRTFDNFWIEAGALGANLGAGKPGNQLDMTRYTRVFFGAPPTDVAVNTIIDHITLVWDNEVHSERTLKFGNNGMDKLNVPPAGDRSVLFYKNKTLLFTRQANGSFKFTVGGAMDLARWRAKSIRENASYSLPRGRKWGLF